MINETAKAQSDSRKEGEESSIETMTAKDAAQFPIMAGGMITTLYFMMKFFGPEVVNQLLLVYFAFGSTTGVKAAVLTFLPQLKSMDKSVLVDWKSPLFHLYVT